jgi:hypothetical protein
MINFFRHIRRQFLIKNKFGKYLLYGIGEIILVVIGILIALQVNNWNEQRKILRQERQLLVELTNNLDANIAALRVSNDMNSRTIKGIDTIVDNFQKSRTRDSMRLFFTSAVHIQTLNLSFATFETIKTNGFDMLNNQSLRLAIIHLFEVSYPHQVVTVSQVGPVFFQTWFNWNTNNGHLLEQILNQSDRAKDDNYYFILNYITTVRTWREAMTRVNNRLIEESLHVKQLIEANLEE